MELTARYLDLDSNAMECPYNCSGAGSCRDPFRMPVRMMRGRGEVHIERSSCLPGSSHQDFAPCSEIFQPWRTAL